MSAGGVLHLQGLDVRQRLIRSAKIWGLMWLLMLLSVPLVIIHFVLVPAFLIAGPVMAVRRYRVTELPHHLSGICPSCKQDLTVAAESFDRLPIWVPCPACRASLHVHEKAE
jgi:hypothetical protein